MTRLHALAFAALFAATAAPAQNAPQQLRTVPLTVGGMHVIQAQVATSPEQRATGLMHRRDMPTNHGMLFVFEEAQPQCFWMRNTLLPLSIAFIDDAGQIVNIAEMKALDETSHCSAQPVRYALEMNQGWFAKRGLKKGSKLGGGPWAK
jgi:uncharacterized protein